MAVQNFPPADNFYLQPRNWTLAGNQPGGQSLPVTDSLLTAVYSSDNFRVENVYAGLGGNVQVGQNIGFVIEKSLASAPASEIGAYDTRFNQQVTAKDNSGQKYTLTRNNFINIFAVVSDPLTPFFSADPPRDMSL